MAIRVFLVDDHGVLRSGLQALLEIEPDIEVVGESGHARQAVRLVQELAPDVVVMDISMPELNGIEATLQIRQSCPSTQIVVLSMYYTSEHIFRALEAGARGYVVKESAGSEVIKAIREVYSRRSYLSQKISDRVVEDYAQSRTKGFFSPLGRLSNREREVLQLVVEGKSNSAIADILCLSVKTVETYRSRLKNKLGIDTLADLVKLAIKQGLISSD